MLTIGSTDCQLTSTQLTHFETVHIQRTPSKLFLQFLAKKYFSNWLLHKAEFCANLVFLFSETRFSTVQFCSTARLTKNIAIFNFFFNSAPFTSCFWNGANCSNHLRTKQAEFAPYRIQQLHHQDNHRSISSINRSIERNSIQFQTDQSINHHIIHSQSTQFALSVSFCIVYLFQLLNSVFCHLLPSSHSIDSVFNKKKESWTTAVLSFCLVAPRSAKDHKCKRFCLICPHQIATKKPNPNLAKFIHSHLSSPSILITRKSHSHLLICLFNPKTTCTRLSLSLSLSYTY